MKDFASYYDVLRISENATGEEIKKTYRKLVLQFHPDRVSPEAPDLKDLAEEEFKRIQEAYDVLSVPEKRKQYDEQLKNLKAGQAANQGGAGVSPVVRVDKNYLQFTNLKPGVSASDILTVFNDGRGALIGTITADKPWVQFSETVISTPDYQEIEITIDTVSFPAGFSDSALVMVDTNGGNETVAVDISMESDFLALLFSVYLKPFFKSFRVWVLVTVLSALFLISCLIYSCNNSAAVNKTGWLEKSVAFISEIPKLEDLQGNWFGQISPYNDAYLCIFPRENYFEGRIFIAGIIGKIKGEIRKNGEIVFKIESFDDVFADLIGRTVGFSEFLSGSFAGRLKGDKIEASSGPDFTLSRVDNSADPWLILKSLISSIENAGRFKALDVFYDVEFEKVWEATLKALERQKEKIRFESREEKIIITYATDHSSLLGDYVHKYVVLFRKQGKTTEVIVKQFRYGLVSSSPISDSTYATDVYFFVPLEKELRKKTGRSNFVIQRKYLRKSFLSGYMELITLEFTPKIIFRQY
ncbi:MAG: J domain-containing protein [Candidatus Omnitrophota bacterium]|jgi:hypothetical protein